MRASRIIAPSWGAGMAIKVKADVAGTVWKITAQAGAVLAADDEIMILESMKMEIPVSAPAAGRLVRLLVAEGEMVAEGQDLAEIDAS